MKLASIAAIVVALGLGACGAGAGHARQTTVPPMGRQVDHVKMAKVEYAARARGVDVIWVNPPTLR